ncbi:MAG: hypothetical protein M3463_13980 [Verrucomicrobiota bacterium]|nr:hypothetical protein [Verrucomicrobiota bacterium]
MTIRNLRLAGAALLAVYGISCLWTPGSGGLLDGVDLAIHETGHLLFSPFGEVATALGGTLFQLIIPAAFFVSFWRRGDRYAAAYPLWWMAQNLWNISVYVADARAQDLPLVGGGEHDWTFLLGEAGWLARDVALGEAIHATGVAVYMLSLVLAIKHASAATSVQPVEELA